MDQMSFQIYIAYFEGKGTGISQELLAIDIINLYVENRHLEPMNK